MAAALSQARTDEAKPKLPRGGRNGNEPVYTEALAEEICDRLATGEPLNVICRDPHMPHEKAVRKWAKRAPILSVRCILAREILDTTV